MRDRPVQWYSMTPAEQALWERQQRERHELAAVQERIARAEFQALEDLARLRRQAGALRADYEATLAGLRRALATAEGELRLVERWLDLQGQRETFAAWRMVQARPVTPSERVSAVTENCDAR